MGTEMVRSRTDFATAFLMAWAVCSFSAAASEVTNGAGPKEIATERDRSTAAKLVFGLLSNKRYAYRAQPLDDALSSKILDAYVEALDPRKVSRTTASDQLIEQHRHGLDDAIKRGRLDPVYEIAAALRGTDDRDRDLEAFLSAYARVSDGRGSYKSPFVKAVRSDAVDDTQVPAARISFVESGAKRIGVIRLAHLQPTAAKKASAYVLDALTELDEEKIDAAILDLRGNPGGALREAVEIAGLFLGSVPVAQIRETNGRVSTESSNVQRKWGGSLAVLIDRKTAAGAEILAAALQDHGRSVLVGD